MSIESMHNQCMRKRVFRDPSKAAKVAALWNKKAPPEDGKVFHEYSCPWCFRWHVGRTTKGK